MGQQDCPIGKPLLLAGWLLAAVLLSSCGGEPGEAPRAEEPASAPTAGDVPDRPAGPFHFVDVSAATGLDFTHVNGMFGEHLFVEVLGPGAAFLDFDNDGDLDIYAVQGYPLEPLTNGEPNETVTDRLYRNELVETGELRFSDVTESAGIRAVGYGIGVIAGDYNNDGYHDIYVNNWGDNQLWRNDRDGTFTDVTAQSGTNDPRWSISSSFADLNNDGWMDLVVVNYDRYTLAIDHPCVTASGRRNWCGPLAYSPDIDSLFMNRGDGTFEDASLRSGFSGRPGAGLGVVVADLDQDGLRDIFVANDGMENHVWIQQPGGGFVENGLMSGLAVNAEGMSEASMGVAVEDFDGDGSEDVFLTHLTKETNTLYRNLGAGLFVDDTVSMGLARASWSYTGFGLVAADFDSDGWLDIFVANGAVRMLEDQIAEGDPLPLREPDQFFHNTGAGAFVEVTESAAASPDVELVGRGAARGDVDNDGDIDLLALANNGPMRLFENRTENESGWIGLRLAGAMSGGDALGTRVRLSRSDGLTLVRRVATDGSYASSNDPRLLFGLGAISAPDTVIVEWASGKVEQWTGLAAGRYHTLTEGEGTAPSDIQ